MQNYESRENQEIKVSDDDQITTLEWLHGKSSSHSAMLLVGTLMGHLYLFEIADK